MYYGNFISNYMKSTLPLISQTQKLNPKQRNRNCTSYIRNITRLSIELSFVAIKNTTTRETQFQHFFGFSLALKSPLAIMVNRLQVFSAFLTKIEISGSTFFLRLSITIFVCNKNVYHKLKLNGFRISKKHLLFIFIKACLPKHIRFIYKPK